MVSFDWILLGLRILAAIILCSFLGLAFYIIWRDLKTTVRATTQTPAMSRLRIMNAMEESLEGQIVGLQPITFLGSAPDNTVVLNDSTVSNRHARISRENGTWLLEDLGSREGTLLNNLLLSKPASLVDGDIIGIGEVRLRVEFG
jgi:hypothetical protein